MPVANIFYHLEINYIVILTRKKPFHVNCFFQPYSLSCCFPFLPQKEKTRKAKNQLLQGIEFIKKEKKN